jgi:hypothetical protein
MNPFSFEMGMLAGILMLLLILAIFLVRPR